MIAAVVAVPVIVFGIQWVTAEPRGALSARERIQSGDFRIAAYEHFFDLCSSIQGMEGQLDALEQELKLSLTVKRREQVQASVTGLRGQRARSIARYNADASKDYTAGQFRDAGLPFRLYLEEGTVCAI